MTDGLDFSPLSDAEREAAAHELERDGAPDEAKPTCAPADAESPEAAAARLFGRAPDALWRYADAAEGARLLRLPMEQAGRRKGTPAAVMV